MTNLIALDTQKLVEVVLGMVAMLFVVMLDAERVVSITIHYYCNA